MATVQTQTGHQKKARPALEKIALVGNPNVGKSVIFGLLTGKYVTVSNYPGTTVELTQGNISLDGKRLLIIDTPGVNTLIPMSEDERVTRDILLEETPSAILQVGDAKNLKRTLMITLQLSEMGLPVVLDLNMIDEARDRGITIDMDALSKDLGVEVVGTIAPQRKGLKELREAVLQPRPARIEVRYNSVIEDYIGRISRYLPDTTISRRSLALMILAEDESLRDWLTANLNEGPLSAIEGLRDECKLRVGESLAYLINRSRLEVAEQMTARVMKKAGPGRGKLFAVLGQTSMHPLYGIPVLVAVLVALYEFVGVFGAGILVDFVQHVIFDGYVNPMAKKVVAMLLPAGFFQDLLVGEYGLITVALTYAIAIILPISVTFFIAFAILEDSGYLPRLAIMSNRVFNLIGLNGKAVLPMVLGLGCGTMAVMTSRILETRRDRIITTFLLALAIPCSAQLGVILGILGSLSLAAAAVWTGSIILVLLVSGFLASKVVRGERTEFFLEIPPIRMPDLTNIAIKTLGRVEWYLKEAVPLFILGTLILFLLHEFHMLAFLERVTSPVIVNLLGLPPKATEAFIIGFLRRDYGAAGLFAMSQQGLLTPVQAVVSLVTVTLFIPCLANFFMIIKERGVKATVWIVLTVFVVAFTYGALLNWVLRHSGIEL